jgi:DNA-binding response OmpR family regulator
MRVLVVDDHREVLELVERALGRDQHQVFTAGSAERALEELSAQRPEIVVLDLGLPDGSGEDLCRKMRSSSENPAILVLTAQSAVASRVRCLDAGADDYLTKPFAVAELRARVRALSRRTQLAAPRVWRHGGVVLDFPARRALVGTREAPITAREWAILDCLAREGGRVVPRQQLLEQVWARVDAAAAASLEVLIGRIRRKLGSDAVRTSRGGGYALANE